jgi:urate oxidase
MGISLGYNQYGKAEIHLVRITRDGGRHEIRDLTVTTGLRGDFSAAHLEGDQANVLPTDTQKNTVFAFAKEHGVGAAEQFALTLARHFVDTVEPVAVARVTVHEVTWARIAVEGEPHDHSFMRAGSEIRTATVTVQGRGAEQRGWAVSGIRDLVVLKSTGSEFRGFLTDRYTTLAETDDRVLATSLDLQWRHGTLAPFDGTERVSWDNHYSRVRDRLLGCFAEVHSRALQQTLWEMGRSVLVAEPAIAEVRLSAPNLHHFLVDLEPFGLDNAGEVYFAADRPYGLIQANVVRDGAPEAGLAWHDEGAR